jgi:hypothetical protein
MALEIDFTTYVRPLRVHARAAPVLASRLAHAAPADLGGRARAALDAVHAAANDVQAVQSERDRAGPRRTRAARDAHNSLWGALYSVLTALRQLEGTRRAERAAMLVETLFPKGLSFLSLDAGASWSEGVRYLTRIHDEGLAAELDAVAGPEFLEVLKQRSAALANAVGVGDESRRRPRAAALAAALARFGHAVCAYARVMAADVEVSEEASAARFLRAMAPIDEHRASARRGRAAPGEETASEARAAGGPIELGLAAGSDEEKVRADAQPATAEPETTSSSAASAHGSADS